MSHIKLTSIPSSWSIKDLIANISNKLQLTDEQIKNIKLIHQEDVDGVPVFRIAFSSSRLIDEIKQKAVKGSGRNAYKIQLEGQNLKFIIVDNIRERFKLRNIAKDRRMANLVLMIKNEIDGDIYDVVSKLAEYKVPIKYISYTKTSTFVGFASKGQAKFVKNKMTDEGSDVRYSLTFMYLEKYTFQDNTANLNPTITTPAAVPFHQPPLVRFPSFNCNYRPITSNSTNPVPNSYIDLRQQLEDNRLLMNRNNIVNGLSNQSMVIPGSAIAEMFDIKISFVPKNVNN